MEYASLHGHRIGYRWPAEVRRCSCCTGSRGALAPGIPAMQLLQRDHAVLAPDFLGHGESAKPPGDYSLGNLAASMRDLLHLLEIERATVIGQSYGGGVALQFAYQFPELCERLVLVDAGGLGREVSWILRLATLPAAAVRDACAVPLLRSRVGGHGGAVLPQSRHSQSPGRGGLERLPVVDQSGEPQGLRHHHAGRDRPGRAVGERHGPPVPGRAHADADRVGDEDSIIPVVHAHKVHEAIPNSQLRIMEGVGHFPHAEEPARFVEILEEFLHGTEPSHVTAEQMRARCARGPADPSGALQGVGVTAGSGAGRCTARRTSLHHGEELGMAAAPLGDDTKKGGENIWISRMSIDLA